MIISLSLAACQSGGQVSTDSESSNQVETEEAADSSKEASDTPALSQDYSAFESTEHLVTSIINQYELNQEAVSVAYYHFPTGEEFYFNERESMLAGSTTKVGLARLYADLVSEGVMTWQSELPYSQSFFEEGAGPITNGEKKTTYSLYELFYFSLAQSDNTAFNILYSYYQQNYGNVQQALMNLSGLEFDQPEATTNNMADAKMLLNILLPLATESEYSYVLTSLSGHTENEYFREYVQDGMITKYGSINGSLHDTGIYFEDGEPVYALVVMTNGQGSVGEFLAMMNFRINEWTIYQEASE